MTIDAGHVRALAARLVTPELIVFPVRHHSPACAWQLRRLFDELSPSMVLVEGPRSFTPHIPLLAHAEAIAPFAMYTYIVQGPKTDPAGGAVETSRRAAYYPFCDYSPELVALREAHRRGLPARFIDLDFAEQCQLEPADEEGEGQHSLLDERRYQRSAHLQSLADRLGCRDHEELWEHLFEVDSPNVLLQEHVARVAAYCQLSRVDYDEAELAADGTLQREAEMAWHVQEALKVRAEGAGPVLAVVGGFHAVVLPALLDKPPERPKITRGNVTDENSALIRYGFDRLDRLNGYSAGMTSPAWHQLLWERGLRHVGRHSNTVQVRQQAALDMLADITVALRGEHGVTLPMPVLAAAYEQVLRLTHLRNRRAPVRDDVLDAVTSCLIKGDADADGALVLAAAHRALRGSRMGKVPPGAHTPPLVSDVAWRLRRQRLKVEDSQPRRLVLNLYRRPEHRITSRLLHGLAMLSIPFAVRTAGPDFVNGIGLDKLQEHWEYAYTAATEGALVEASVYGMTLPLAVASRFTEQLDRIEGSGAAKDASAAARLMTQACVLGLHDHLPRITALLRRAIGEDAAFDSVAAAANNLGLLWESREPLEARDLEDLPALLQAVYERAIYLGRELRGKQCDPRSTIDALATLRELLVSAAGRVLDSGLYWSMVEDLQHNHGIAHVKGAAAGLRYAAGQISDEDLSAALDGHFRGMLPPAESVGFLGGLLRTAREAAWQQPRLLEVLDQLLQAWNEDAFVTNLPELRLAFSGMTPKETDRIADAVARLHGKEDLGSLVVREVGAEDVQRHLEISRVLGGILERDGLGGWVSP